MSRGAPPPRSYAGQTRLAAQIPAIPGEAPPSTTPVGRGGAVQFDLRPAGFDLRPVNAPAESQAPGFLGGIREMFLPADFQLSDLYQGPAFALRHPIESGRLLYGAAKEAGLQQGEQAGQAYAGGRYPEAIGHGLAAAIPMIGPVAANVGETIGRGEFARGAGNLVGLFGPGIAARLAKLRPPGAVERSPLPEAALERVRTTPSERGSAAARTIEPIAERSVAGGGRFQEFRQAQQADLMRWADDVVEQISGYRGTPEEVGIQVDQAIRQAKDVIRNQTRQMYAAIDEAVTPQTVRRPVLTEEPSQLVGPRGEALTTTRRTMRPEQVGGVQPKTLPIRQEAAKLLRRLNEVRTIPSQELSQIRAQLESLVRLPPRTTFYDFQTGRSILLEVTRRFDDPVSGRRAGISRQLAGKMDEAMETALRDAGREDLLGELRDANELTKYLHETFNETVMHKILDSAPEKAHLFLTAQNTPLADLRRIRGTIPRETWQAMKVQIVNDMLNQATRGEMLGGMLRYVPDAAALAGEIGTGGVTGGMAGAMAGRAAAAAAGARLRGGAGGLMARLEKIGQERLNIIFDQPSEQANLLAIAQTADRVGVRPESWIAAALNAHIYYKAATGAGKLMVGDIAGGAANLGTAAAWATAQNLLARALLRQPTNGPFIRSVRSLIEAMGTGNAEDAARAARSVNTFLVQEERKLVDEQGRAAAAVPLPPLPPAL